MRRLYFDCGDKTQFPALLISRVEMKEGSTVCCSLWEGGREFPFSFLPLLPHLTKCRSSVSRRIMSSTDRRGELTDVLPCLHCGTLLKMNYCCKSAVTMTPRARMRGLGSADSSVKLVLVTTAAHMPLLKPEWTQVVFSSPPNLPNCPSMT